jgi:hypothetical protein
MIDDGRVGFHLGRPAVCGCTVCGCVVGSAGRVRRGVRVVYLFIHQEGVEGPNSVECRAPVAFVRRGGHGEEASGQKETRI